jgi:hypothetical protein
MNGRDIRMVQRRQYVRFMAETRQPIRIVHKCIGQNLERHLARQLCILRAIDLAHAAFADQIDDAIGADHRAGREIRRDAERRSSHVHQRAIDQSWRARLREQRFDLTSQLGVVTTHAGKVRASRSRLLLHRRLIDARDLLPAFRRHGGSISLS